MKKTLKKITIFDINNKLDKNDIAVHDQGFIKTFEIQEYFKNGKNKGKPYEQSEKCFFSNLLNFTSSFNEIIMKNNKTVDIYKTHIKLAIDEDYKSTILKNIDKLNSNK